MWLFLDGLDEVDPKDLDRARQSIEGWCRELPDTVVVVLSRPVAVGEADPLRRCCSPCTSSRWRAASRKRWWAGW